MYWTCSLSSFVFSLGAIAQPWREVEEEPRKKWLLHICLLLHFLVNTLHLLLLLLFTIFLLLPLAFPNFLPFWNLKRGTLAPQYHHMLRLLGFLGLLLVLYRLFQTRLLFHCPLTSDNCSPISHLKFDFVEVAKEVRYWEASVVCYVMGANPLWMSLRILWRGFGQWMILIRWVW